MLSGSGVPGGKASVAAARSADDTPATSSAEKWT
jgi:hypothetical protein